MERIARNDTSWNTIQTHPDLTALVMTHHKTADPEDTAHEVKKLLRWWVGPEQRMISKAASLNACCIRRLKLLKYPKHQRHTHAELRNIQESYSGNCFGREFN